MFRSARIKLTAWYLLIIMTISITFSFVIYLRVNRDLSRLERIQRVVREQERRGESLLPQNLTVRSPRLEPEMIRDVRIRTTTTLIIVNAIILIVSGFGGYFLAGRTLRPIAEMVDEQGRFVTDASHELRTPLTALKTEIEVALRDKKLNLTDAKILLKSNLEEVDNLQVLTESLIELVQYQKSKGPVEFEYISLNALITQAVKKVTPLAKKKQVGIRVKDHNGKILGDPRRLVELLVILLDNAIKYNRPSGTIKVSTVRTDHHVEILIQDNGVGIDAGTIPHIFNRFYRADSSRTKGGYGLGLSIAKKIVELHKGSITVESKIGKGTTFTIHLPV